MAKSIFTIALEDDSIENVEAVPAEQVEEQVDAVIAAEDVTEEVLEAEQQVEAFENDVEVAEEIEEQVQEQEQVLEQKPEEVTEEVVEIAQEAFAINLGRLRVNYQEFKDLYKDSHKSRLAFEDDGNMTPVKKLTIATEGMKEVLKTIKDKIKAIFRAIGNVFRKIWQKIVIMMDKSAKQAKGLLDVLKDKKIKTNLSKEDKEAIYKIFPLNSSFAKYGKSFIPRVENALGSAKTFSSSLNGAIEEALQKTISQIKGKAIPSAKDVEKAVSSFSYSTEEGVIMFLLRSVNSKLKLFCIDDEDQNVKINDDKCVEEFKKQCFLSSADSVKPLSQSELSAILNTALSNANATKSFVDKINTIRKETEKDVDKVSADDESGELKSLTKFLKLCQSFGTTVCMEITADYIDYNKAAIRLVNLHLEK